MSVDCPGHGSDNYQLNLALGKLQNAMQQAPETSVMAMGLALRGVYREGGSATFGQVLAAFHHWASNTARGAVYQDALLHTFTPLKQDVFAAQHCMAAAQTCAPLVQGLYALEAIRLTDGIDLWRVGNLNGARARATTMAANSLDGIDSQRGTRRAFNAARKLKTVAAELGMADEVKTAQAYIDKVRPVLKGMKSDPKLSVSVESFVRLHGGLRAA